MILADENVDLRIIRALRGSGIEVISIFEISKGITDSKIIELAIETNMILLTEDKDFGEWVFAHKQKGLSVIFLRYQFKELDKIILSLLSVLGDSAKAFHGFYTTITPRKIRQRQL